MQVGTHLGKVLTMSARALSYNLNVSEDAELSRRGGIVRNESCRLSCDEVVYTSVDAVQSIAVDKLSIFQ